MSNGSKIVYLSKFKEYINQKYAISYGSIMREDDVLEETEDA
jgi:hypothetical protein